MALKQPQQQRRSGGVGVGVAAPASASSAAMDLKRQPCANARGSAPQADHRPLPSSSSLDNTRTAGRDGGGGAATNEDKNRSFGSSNNNKPVTNTTLKTMMRRKDSANLQVRKETAAQLAIKAMPINAKFKTVDLGEIRKGALLSGDYKMGFVSKNANKEEGGGDEKKSMGRKSVSGSRECVFAEMGVKILAVGMPPFMQAHAVTCARATHDASVSRPSTKNLAFSLKKEATVIEVLLATSWKKRLDLLKQLRGVNVISLQFGPRQTATDRRNPGGSEL